MCREGEHARRRRLRSRRLRSPGKETAIVTYRRGRWAALLALWAILASPVCVSRAESACPDGQAPAFVAGFASLHEHLGAVMGEPLDCERTELRSGNAQQQTTTGIAVYQGDTNTLEFTNGRE